MRTAGTGIGNAAYRQLCGLDVLVKTGEADGWKISVLRYAPELSTESFREKWQRFTRFEMIDCTADSEAHPSGDWWQQVRLPNLIKERAVDAVFSPAYVGPLRSHNALRIIMVHDDLLWTQPDSYPLKFRMYLQTMTRLSARASHRVVYPSADARRRCDALLKLDSRRTGVVPNGIDVELFQPGPLEGREPLAVCVASAERRKNHEVLLHALKQVPDMRMLFVGISEKATLRVKELEAIMPRGRWDILPVAQEETVRDYLRRAALFVLPSRGEGFGFPVVEAMGCGTPMVLSDIAVLREVAGDAALYRHPDDAAGWAAAMREAAEAVPGTAERRVAGLARVRQFSCENSARALLREIEESLR